MASDIEVTHAVHYELLLYYYVSCYEEDISPAKVP